MDCLIEIFYLFECSQVSFSFHFLLPIASELLVMTDRKILRRLVRTGRKKLASLEKKSPGKLLKRHLLCKSLNKWSLLRKQIRSLSSWDREDARTCAVAWDEEDDFDSLESLHEFPISSDDVDLSPLEALADAVDFYCQPNSSYSPHQISAL